MNSIAFPSKNRSHSSVFQGNNTPRRRSLQVGRLPAVLRVQEWDRYGWSDSVPAQNDALSYATIYLSRQSTSLTERKHSQRRLSSFISAPEAEQSPPLTTLSLPALPTNGHGDPMLRRPTYITAKAISEDGEVFSLLSKGNKLKPFSFMGNDAKVADFYKTHYPLLLDKLTENVNSAPPGNKIITEKQAKEHFRISTAEKRLLSMRQRIKETERKLLELEEGPEGEGMVTELRDDVFNPLIWSYNR